MADPANPMLSRSALTLRPELTRTLVTRTLPDLRVFRPPVRTAPPGVAAPPAAAPPAATPPVVLPVAPPTSDNPFNELPYPSPGDRIKAEDFRRLSQSLAVLQQMTVLSAALFGHTLGEARLALAAQQFVVERVLTVFGREVPGGDASLDSRTIVQVMPVALGERGLLVVVAEAVETRRLAPNLIGRTYGEARDLLRATVGDAGGRPRRLAREPHAGRGPAHPLPLSQRRSQRCPRPT